MLYFLRYLVVLSRGVMGRSLLLSEAAQFLCLFYQPAGKAAEQTLLAISICIEAFEMKVMKSGDILCVLGGSSGWLIFSMDFYSTSPIVPLINNYQNYRRAVYRDRHILVRLCDVCFSLCLNSETKSQVFTSDRFIETVSFQLYNRSFK